MGRRVPSICYTEPMNRYPLAAARARAALLLWTLPALLLTPSHTAGYRVSRTLHCNTPAAGLIGILSLVWIFFVEEGVEKIVNRFVISSDELVYQR